MAEEEGIWHVEMCVVPHTRGDHSHFSLRIAFGNMSIIHMGVTLRSVPLASTNILGGSVKILALIHEMMLT